MEDGGVPAEVIIAVNRAVRGCFGATSTQHVMHVEAVVALITAALICTSFENVVENF